MGCSGKEPPSEWWRVLWHFLHRVPKRVWWLQEGPCCLPSEPVPIWPLPCFGHPRSLPRSSFSWAWRALCLPSCPHTALKCYPDFWSGEELLNLRTLAQWQWVLWKLDHPHTVGWYLSSHSGSYFGKILCIKVYIHTKVYTHIHIYVCIWLTNVKQMYDSILETVSILVGIGRAGWYYWAYDKGLMLRESLIPLENTAEHKWRHLIRFPTACIFPVATSPTGQWHTPDKATSSKRRLLLKWRRLMSLQGKRQVPGGVRSPWSLIQTIVTKSSFVSGKDKKKPKVQLCKWGWRRSERLRPAPFLGRFEEADSPAEFH